ncbi:MAG: hypothetical protein AAFO28_06035 [Pseudomonadota bacterium]
MISRALWILAVIALGFVTVSVQLDRQARIAPARANSVPEPFRAFAQRHITAEALLAQNEALALKEARRLVARRPMPAEHLRMLSLAQFAAGESEQSVYTIQLAARRGWRDQPSQSTMLRLALAAGDQAEAARRYAALFSQGGVDESELKGLGDLVFGDESEEARAQFAQVVTDAARWQRIYLRKGPNVLPPEAFVDVTKRVTQAGVRFECDGKARAVQRLSRADKGSSEALKAILDYCP